MSEEEAIKYLTNIKDDIFIHKKNQGWIDDINRIIGVDNGIIAIETVLNMLEKKNEEIERSEVEYHELAGEINRLETELEEKDKIINEMAEQLEGLSIFDNDIDDVIILGNKEDVKKYFERKVENEN